MPVSWSGSPTSRPRAAPSSNGWKARNCRASRRWRHAELTPLVVHIHDLGQARAVLDAAGTLGCEVELATAPGMAAFAGVGFWHAIEGELGRPVIVDCGEDAGLVLAALRTGCRALLFTGPERTAARLADMAGQFGARFVRELPGDVLSLLPEDDTCRIAELLASSLTKPW